MKKVFALMLALCLMLGCTALAENEISWEQITPTLEAAGITGEFVTFDEIAVKVFIFNGMAAQELSDEDRQNGYIGYYAAEDGSAIAIQYVDVNGMTLEDYTANLPEAGATEIETGTVNGLPCVSYAFNGNLCCSFTTEKGYILEVSVGPVEDDNAKFAAAAVLASIQPATAE